MDPEVVRANYERVKAEVGPNVTVVAATKYVAVEDMPALAEAGIEVVGENRLQDLEAKHARYGDLFRWHFIGHLQSRKARDVSELCELVHSLDSESAAKRLTVPALVQVNLAGEGTKSGVSPDELAAFVASSPVEVRGLATMPPLAEAPEASRPYFRRLRELAEGLGLRELSMGTSQDYRVAAEEGATYVRVGASLWRHYHSGVMGLGDLWNRTLVYFGIAEEYDDAWDDDGYLSEDDVEQSYAERPSANVRRLTPRGRSGDDYDDWTVSESNVLPVESSADTMVGKPARELAPVPSPQPRSRQSSRQSSKQSSRSRPPVQAVPPPPGAQVHLVLPRSFNDAQQIADRFKQGVPVIVNLQNADQELSKRLVDFASGLTYALNGSMQRVADRVFLLTPHNVQVSAEERARVLESGGFFNQA
jgi:uncharacterized pyridoxal phosphate-containing UPF0001 family protein/FtsZ-interacting cell division protein YlmF